MLGFNAPFRAASSIEERLEKPVSAYNSRVVTNTTAAIAAQYVLHAGEALARAAKSSRPGNEHILGRGKWKVWGEKLKEIEETVGEEAEWDLRGMHSGRMRGWWNYGQRYLRKREREMRCRGVRSRNGGRIINSLEYS